MPKERFVSYNDLAGAVRRVLRGGVGADLLAEGSVTVRHIQVKELQQITPKTGTLQVDKLIVGRGGDRLEIESDPNPLIRALSDGDLAFLLDAKGDEVIFALGDRNADGTWPIMMRTSEDPETGNRVRIDGTVVTGGEFSSTVFSSDFIWTGTGDPFSDDGIGWNLDGLQTYEDDERTLFARTSGVVEIGEADNYGLVPVVLDKKGVVANSDARGVQGILWRSQAKGTTYSDYPSYESQGDTFQEAGRMTIDYWRPYELIRANLRAIGGADVPTAVVRMQAIGVPDGVDPAGEVQNVHNATIQLVSGPPSMVVSDDPLDEYNYTPSVLIRPPAGAPTIIDGPLLVTQEIQGDISGAVTIDMYDEEGAPLVDGGPARITGQIVEGGSVRLWMFGFDGSRFYTDMTEWEE